LRADTGKTAGVVPSRVPGVVGDVALDPRHVLLAQDGVDLVEDEHHLLAPGADLLEEGALALGERPVGRGDEEDEVGVGDELAGDRLVLAEDRVGPRGVDYLDLAQQLDRRGDEHHAAPRLARLPSRPSAGRGSRWSSASPPLRAR
jgi:hypothetical protein